MKVLVDTNVLLRALQIDHADHEISAGAINSLRKDRHVVMAVPQVVYEYWVVATRPIDRNGFGMPAPDVEQRVHEIVRLFRIHRDERGIFEIWRKVVVQHQVIGKQAHDARLVAAMQRHGIDIILTFNVQHFARYPAIRAVSPHDVVSGQISF